MRAAVLIHERLAGSKSQDVPLYLPEYSWNNIQRLRRQIDMARQRGWQAAIDLVVPAEAARTRDERRADFRHVFDLPPDSAVLDVSDRQDLLLWLDWQ